jgi:CBS-domain-containing membrane protein
MDALAQSEAASGAWLERLTVIDAPSAAKALSAMLSARRLHPPSSAVRVAVGKLRFQVDPRS